MRAKALRLVAAGGVAAAVMLPSAAMAQDVGTYGGGGTNPNGGGKGPGSTSQAASSGANNSGGSLPFTGGDVVGLALIGAGAIVGGTALARSGRKRVAEV
jgi:hypothetical protein